MSRFLAMASFYCKYSTGKNCEFEVDECESQPCQNGGTCTAVSGGFNCSCPANYKGRCSSSVEIKY